MTETAIDGIDFELDDALTLLERTPRVLCTWLEELLGPWRAYLPLLDRETGGSGGSGGPGGPEGSGGSRGG